MTQTGQKNRDFSQISVGTIVAFDNPRVCNVVAGKGYQIFQQAENRNGKWFMLSGETEYASESISPKSWEMDGGYIVSNPGEILADPDQTSLQKTQNIAGQNSAVRTREEQIASYPETVCVGQYPGKSWVLEIDVDDLDPDQLIEDAVSYVRADIAYNCEKQAEARGAEEQRRKDAEFAKLIAEKSAKIRLLGEDLQSQDGDYAEEVPANVAALEARVKVLEEALEHECWCMSDSGEGLKAINAGHIVQIWLRDEIEKIRAALTREGGE